MKTIPHLRHLTEKIRAFERSGRYQEGFESLKNYWSDFRAEPDTSGLSERDSAELLLSCGILAGFLGRLEDCATAQENSKNLLTKARDLFLELGDEAKVVESENCIAIAYLRKGEYREAETWIKSSFSRALSTDHFARVQSFVFQSLIMLETGRFDDAFSFLKSVEKFFQDFDDDYLNGCFASNLGVALKNLGKLPEAMQMYSLARYFHQGCGNLVYLATVENNLANLYRIERRFELAHHAVDKAIELHRKAGDKSRYGFSFDTKALIFLEEGKLQEAERFVDQGIGVLRGTEFSEFLVETLFTKVKIQIAGNNLAGAAITFSEVAKVVNRFQGLERLEKRAKEFEALVRNGLYRGLSRILTERVIPGEELEFELTPALERFTQFDAIWIKNDHFADLGLKKGCLALVTNEEVVTGDLVAVAEVGSEEAICGFLDTEPGLVVISNNAAEPISFSEGSVEIVGKIVGFVRPENRVDGKMKVEPLIQDESE